MNTYPALEIWHNHSLHTNHLSDVANEAVLNVPDNVLVLLKDSEEYYMEYSNIQHQLQLRGTVRH